MKRRLLLLFLSPLALAALFLLLSAKKHESKVRLLYWNIQMGMWDGQRDNYDRFVDWVNSKNPDICVWCEGASHVKTESEETIKKEDRFLPGGWPEIAARYGHNYVFVGGYRDPFPQVITSRYPIDSMGCFIGNAPDSVVMHGAGWAKVRVDGKDINVVTLHLQPFSYWRFLPAAKKEESKKDYGGEKYRRMEMKWILDHTVRTHSAPENELWMVMGDFNARSRKDNFQYKLSPASQDFLTHNYIEESAPYLYDVVAELFPETFCPSHGKKRIDYIYVTKPLLKSIKNVETSPDAYTKQKPSGINKFMRPSDHLPIIVDFKLDKIK